MLMLGAGSTVCNAANRRHWEFEKDLLNFATRTPDNGNKMNHTNCQNIGKNDNKFSEKKWSTWANWSFPATPSNKKAWVERGSNSNNRFYWSDNSETNDRETLLGNATTQVGGLTSYPRNTAIWKERSCMGITVRIPCRQSTVWGTSSILYANCWVSRSPLLQMRMGRPCKSETQMEAGVR